MNTVTEAVANEAYRQGWKIGWAAGVSGLPAMVPGLPVRRSVYEPCLFSDISDGECALRATIDDPPPTHVQMRELVLKNKSLVAEIRGLEATIARLEESHA